MTTIAANSALMAADSQSTEGSLITKTQKIFKVNGDIIGFAGNHQDGLLFVEWYKHKGDKPALDDFQGLVLTRDGSLFAYEDKLVPIPIHEPFASIGSGSHLAIGAMEMGADPVQAVKVAAKWDAYTKAPVKVLKL